MKTVKDAELRRQEILMTARELFIKKGYDKTSVNDILKVVDIAKGTFYYYFSSTKCSDYIILFKCAIIILYNTPYFVKSLL